MDLIEVVKHHAPRTNRFSAPHIARLIPDEQVGYMTGGRITDQDEPLSNREREVFQLIAAAKLPLSAKISALCTKF